MKKFIKNLVKTFNILILIVGMFIPIILFLNRFLIPDVSFDSVNYHVYLGFKGFDSINSIYEFFPTGMHNFSPILEMPGNVLMNVFGYRLGSIGSLMFLYLSIFVVYLIFKLYNPKTKLLNKWWFGLMFVSMFLSFESFLQIATYYVDIEVAFLMLSATYFLLKYEKTKKIEDLVISSVFVSFFVLGKMATWYYLFPYFGYFLWILISDKKQNFRQKLSKIFYVGIISILLAAPWLFNNLKITGNPVFPYYNGIFKSIYSINNNDFSKVPRFGGRDTMEKLSWGITSIKYPERLGEVHELFTDYKINIYLILAIIAFTWSLFRKNAKLLKFSCFYLSIYLCWSYFFGYLRYGLVLEFLGGLFLLLWFDEMSNIKNNLLIIPIVLIMLVQGKRIINMSLAYDISFRPGYFYNKVNYPKELINLNKNKIYIDKNIINKYNPDVYLNCAIPNLTYYVMSDFNNLPVQNIDYRGYKDMTSDIEYKKISENKISSSIKGEENKVRFVTIAVESGLNNHYLDCINNLKNKNFTILEQLPVDNFLGYYNQKLIVIFGEN